MGMRFRKSIKIAPGVKFNVGKKSVGLSVGGKYGGVSVNSKTGARVRASAPGTGLSYSEKIGKSSTRSGSQKTQDAYSNGDLVEELSPLEQEKLKSGSLDAQLNQLKILLPILCMLLLLLAAALYPILFVAVIGICVWWEKWRKKAAYDLAVAKYRENCLEYDLPIHDPPTNEDISPYRIAETYVDKKHRTRKKKQFFQRWWFIAWAVFNIYGAIVTR